MFRLADANLGEAAEGLITRIVNAAVEVHRHLGPGFLETTYHRAMCIELALGSTPFEAQVATDVVYKGHAIHGQRLDLVVGGLVVVEMKAVAELLPIHLAQLMAYLKGSGLRAGVLLNFNVRLMKEGGIRRVVL